MVLTFAEIVASVEITKNNKTAILFGATGLVGGHCLRQLLVHPAYKKVIAIGRRKLKLSHEKLQQHVIDFDKLEDYSHLIKGHDLFSCLGTTMSKAGDKEAFYKVDFTYAYESARMALKNGANQVLLVSSVGADSDSMFYYPRVKGELEEAMKQLDFWAVRIFQPSVLLGDRQENRLAESIGIRLGKGVDWLTGGQLLGKYKPVEAEDVAKAMLRAAQKLEGGIWIYPSDHIHFMARKEDEEGLIRR